MGRVFDALRRSSAKPAGESKNKQADSQRRNAVRTERVLPNAKQIEEQLFSGSSIINVADNSAYSSASTAHTADAPDGSALPGGMASRAAGATLGAAGATRVADFLSFEISATR